MIKKLLPTHPREWSTAKRITAVICSAVYLFAIVLANVLADVFGLIPLIPGLPLEVVAGTYAIGVVLLARNIGQDLIGRLPIIGLMAIGTVLSWFLATPTLAVASAVTFAISETADMAVYSPLRRRGWALAVMAAVVVSALVDSTVFIYLAGFPFTADSVLGQWIGKVLVTVVAVLITLSVKPLRRIAAAPLDDHATLNVG